MFKIDLSDVEEYEDHLKTFAKRAYPFATKATLNTSAFKARSTSQDRIKRTMTTRNAFTVKSIQVDQARTLRVSRQAAIVGSTAPYMEDQEFGGTVTKRGRYGAVIPTSWAAGQGMHTQPRTKLPRGANKLANIRLAKKIRGGKTSSKRQDAFLRGLLAANVGNKFVFMPKSSTSHAAIFRVWGRRKVRGRYTGIKLKMAYSLRPGGVRVPKNPWLAPSVKEVEALMPEVYSEALRFQLQRHGLFR